MVANDLNVGDWAAPVADLQVADDDPWPQRVARIVPHSDQTNVSAHAVFENGLSVRLDVLERYEKLPRN